MPNINQILRGAEALGDFSSFKTGKVPTRIKHKVVGGTAGKAQASMGVIGLVFGAQFFNFLYTAVRAAAAEEMWVGTVVNYAAGYEYGWANPRPPGKVQRPFFRPGIRDALAERSSASVSPVPNVKDLRSGLYEGSQFLADARSLAAGDPIGRALRRRAGAATTRFFWGALLNPDANILAGFAKLIRRFVRKNIRKRELIETGALLMSVEIGGSLKEMQRNSVMGAAGALGSSHVGEIKGDISMLQEKVG